MKWNVGTKLAAGFGLALLIFVIVGAISYWNTSQFIAAAEWRKHTYEVLGKLDDVTSLIKDVELGQRSYVLTGEESFLEPYQNALGKLDPDVQELRRMTEDNPRQQTRLNSLEPLIKNRLAFARETIDARRTSGLDEGVKLIKTGKGQELTVEIQKLVRDMEADEQALLKKRGDEADADARNTEWTILAGTFAALVVSLVAGWLITRDIAGPLKELTGVAEKITRGDLRVKASVNGRADEVGVLARTFDTMTQSLQTMASTAEQIANGELRASIKPQSPEDVLGNAFARMTENLRQQIQGLVEGANVLGSAASEIVASTAQLSSSSSESAAAVSETTTTVEEVRQTAEMSTQKARAVSETAVKAAQISQNGRKSAEEAVAGMNRIQQQMESIAESMVRLSEQTQAIGQIIATVDDLASQSNLLAVNAAIEAAKAGEQGKGFGVVAQEVKSLAEQSRQATNQVRTILSDIQKATTAAVMATEQGTKAVEAGGRQTEAAGDSIQALTGSVSEAAQTATQIAASSQQQLVGMDQVASAMENIKQASTQNVASAKQLEVSARNLSDLGQRLKQMVERYKV
jgi:methyl-accepting chemotaxis protein